VIGYRIDVNRKEKRGSLNSLPCGAYPYAFSLNGRMPSSNSRRTAVTDYGALAFTTSLTVHAASQTVEALADGLIQAYPTPEGK
jgi:hypothetical protein